MKPIDRPIIGGHVSVAGGLVNGVRRGISIGANAIQIFGGSPRAFRAGVPSISAIREYREALDASPIRAVYLHAAYLVNLASPSRELYEKSIASLTDHLKIAEAIGANGVIFHPGSHGALDRMAALTQEVQGMKAVLSAVPGKAKLLVENTAGGGTKLGGTLEDLKSLVSPFRTSRVGICFDTAHAFESGLVDAYTPTSVSLLIKNIESTVGFERFEVIHANDSMTASGSHHDRHENIGAGEIGIRGFKALLREKLFRGLPWLLETPGFDGTGPDKKNIEILRSCFE